MKPHLVHYSFLVFVIFAIGSQGCKKDSPVEPEPVDTSPPSVFIETPTTDISFVTLGSSLMIAGFADDNLGLNEIRWSNNAGGSGIASGLASWQVSNVSLSIGDNVITVAAIDQAENIGMDEIIITRNEYLNFVGRPILNPTAIFANEPDNVTVRVRIGPNSNLISSSVKLAKLDVNNVVIQELGRMYDDGNLSHGDDIQGDWVFSAIVTINEAQTGSVRLRVVAETQEQSGDVKGYSAVFLLNVINHISAQDDQVLAQRVDSALHRMKYLYENQNMSLTEAVTTTITSLRSLPDVQTVTLRDWQMIKIELTSGLEAGIVLAEVDASGKIITQGSSLFPDSIRRKPSEQLPHYRMTTGHTRPIGKSSIVSENNTIILNKKVLIYEPFADLFWVPSSGTKGGAAKQILESSEVPFQITHLKNQDATVEALFNLTDYGFIIIDTHGEIGESFLSGEINTPATRMKYERLRAEEKVFPVIQAKVDPLLNTFTFFGWLQASYWAVNNRLIQGLDGRFPRSVVFNSSCQSSAYASSPHSLATAFFGKGAKTYLGVTDIASNEFLWGCLIDFTRKFAQELKTTGEAFTPGRVEERVRGGIQTAAGYTINGSREMHYTTSLINGDFELGELLSWIDAGDGRVISQLGSLSPPGGSFMGIISTGLGQTTTSGSISQPFKVDQNQSTLIVKWNFLSEEFLEYIGSQFQDFFKIEIKRGNGQTSQILFKNIDQLASQFGATQQDPGQLIRVSPGIVFDRGDVYMTNWQTSSFDVSAYRSEFITLTLSAGDVGDSIFDTAILLDDITVQ